MKELGSISLDIELRSLTFLSESYGHFHLELDDLMVLGEYSTADGPWLEDLFLVFVCRDGNWWECPFGAMGVPGVLSQFEEVWHAHLTVTLGFSTQYKSRIMWPKELADNELYQFTKGGWLDRMITQGMPATRDLRPEVKEYVAATGNNESNRQ